MRSLHTKDSFHLFSGQYEQPTHSKADERYGRPEQGSKTERRGIKAGKAWWQPSAAHGTRRIYRRLRLSRSTLSAGDNRSLRDNTTYRRHCWHRVRSSLPNIRRLFGQGSAMHCAGAALLSHTASLQSKRAGDYVCQQVLTCCEFIAMRGEHNDDGTVTVTFGDLFALYARYTENVARAARLSRSLL